MHHYDYAVLSPLGVKCFYRYAYAEEYFNLLQVSRKKLYRGIFWYTSTGDVMGTHAVLLDESK
jgi:hypothetical protein